MDAKVWKAMARICAPDPLTRRGVAGIARIETPAGIALAATDGRRLAVYRQPSGQRIEAGSTVPRAVVRDLPAGDWGADGIDVLDSERGGKIPFDPITDRFPDTAGMMPAEEGMVRIRLNGRFLADALAFLEAAAMNEPPPPEPERIRVQPVIGSKRAKHDDGRALLAQTVDICFKPDTDGCARRCAILRCPSTPKALVLQMPVAPWASKEI